MRYTAEAIEDSVLYSIGEQQMKMLEKIVPSLRNAILKTLECLVKVLY